MRLFVATGVFAVQHPPPASGSRNDGDDDDDEPTYMLTPTSRLLVGSQNNLAALTALVTHPAMVTPFFELGKWLQHELPDPCIFKRAHGRTLWEHASRDAAFDALVNDGMLSDSHFIMDIAISECARVFGGISSLVDVGGGLGAAAQAISKAFPDVECSVLDFDHVVAKAPSGTKVRYVVGDMFESVPPADAMFFKLKEMFRKENRKSDGCNANAENPIGGFSLSQCCYYVVLCQWVLHDWGDEECTMILKNCRKSIPPREKGGKVIIIDIVVGAGSSDFRHKEIEALFDIYMMVVNGKERNEQEWKKIFLRAGFSDYKITPVLGVRSIIEVYP
ncbi:hypothetical protein HU200_026747 [Digitaria exilis]|uniref:O-methyltransferase C-terminal domain-containing protein n=1 Tax=Digitaria exilis TaxID=1010633 RepID=A0A835BVE5_9POAL|nr:hypothetical protein HU200_026747 [Digitaria exilis]